MVAANYVAYTAPINPPEASPQLTVEHIWPLLQRKIRQAEEFVAGAIASTDVLSTSTTSIGLPITSREVLFRVDCRRVHEDCIEYKPMKVEFHQPDGSKVQNIVSEGVSGELYMTYTFEWLHPELEGDEAALQKKLAQEKAMAKMAVEGTITAMREMVVDGRWKQTV
jgi:hypothetical protein